MRAGPLECCLSSGCVAAREGAFRCGVCIFLWRPAGRCLDEPACPWARLWACSPRRAPCSSSSIALATSSARLASSSASLECRRPCMMPSSLDEAMLRPAELSAPVVGGTYNTIMPPPACSVSIGVATLGTAMGGASESTRLAPRWKKDDGQLDEVLEQSALWWLATLAAASSAPFVSPTGVTTLAPPWPSSLSSSVFPAPGGPISSSGPYPMLVSAFLCSSIGSAPSPSSCSSGPGAGPADRACAFARRPSTGRALAWAPSAGACACPS